MPARTRKLGALCAAAVAAAVAVAGAGAAGASAETVAPLPSSDYGVSSACAAPAPGRAACMSLKLEPLTAAARSRTHPLGLARAPRRAAPSPAAGSYGLRPQDLHTAYQLPASAPGAQTIAIVDAYNDPNAESDLQGYSEEFGLPVCTTANGCFRQVNQNGAASPLPFPKTNAELEAARKGSTSERRQAEDATGWGLEISLDIEAAHATCQSCKILLVEAKSASYANLETAVRSAIALGADEVSNSYGGPEFGETAEEELVSAFNQPGKVITASAGDSGYLDWDAESAFERGYADFPASSPHVVAVGGTRLSLGSGSSWAGEQVWNGNGAGGGGCSVEFTAPAWQQALSDFSSVGCGTGRAVTDIAAVADPYTGLAVHDTSPICEDRYEEGKVQHVAYWCTIGGTSLSSPVIAAAFALAGGAESVAYPAQSLYENAASEPGSLHDVTLGSNGECAKAFSTETGLSGCTTAEEAADCSSHLICLAAAGYDGPTGLGTPKGVAALTAPAGGSATSGGGSGGGAGGGGSGAGAGSASGTGTTSSGTAAESNGGPGAGATAAAAAVLSRLKLTFKALTAATRGHVRLSQVAFAFTSSAAARVRATLALRKRAGGHIRWVKLRAPLGLSARHGRNSAHLRGRARLAPGVYRLTLAPAGGRPRTLDFRVR